MEHRIQFRWILLLMLTTVCVTQASIVASKYKKLGPGQNVTGTIVVKFTTRSKIQCSDRFARSHSI